MKESTGYRAWAWLAAFLCIGATFAPSTAAASPPAFGPPMAVLTTCPGCHEPSVVVDEAGRVFVMGYGAREVAVSEDDAVSFSKFAGPPSAVPGYRQGDAILHADGAGHLFIAGLVWPVGVQVSRSSDAGQTWDATVFFPAPGADRPWVATGPDGTVYAAFKVNGVELVYRSDDAGASFGPPVVVTPPGRTVSIAGPPIVDAQGRFVQGLFTSVLWWFGGDPRLQLAVSDDGGSTFVYEDVYAPPGASPGAFFPIPDLDAGGVMRMAWLRYVSVGGEQVFQVVASSSTDRGSTWSDPVPWSDAGGVVASPWIAANGDALDLAWYVVTEPGETSSLLFARGSADGGTIERTTVAAGIVSQPTFPAPQNEANTDFAHFAHLQDGRAVVVWFDRAVWLSVESPS